MAEIDWSRWREAARRRLAELDPAQRPDLLGRVESIGDGVAMISGLPSAMLGELVYFDVPPGMAPSARNDTGERALLANPGAGPGPAQLGFIVALDENLSAAVLLDEGVGVEAGTPVRASGHILDVPVGEALLGRIVDPLGRPLDEGPAPACETRLPIERPAPAVVDRALVEEPVETGVLVVDALLALGRGQRELIIGDRATGRTSLAVDVIINQRGSDLVCVYVAVGQSASAVARAIGAVRRHGAPERCIFVVAPAAAPPGLQWLAPFAGMTMAEHVRDGGGHALVVIDDLTRHAATHRELALLIGETPGREAYPGDIFYTHARLLERAARLAPERGGGSLTALPIAETEAGNLAAYIPTNLISITDGQIVLDGALFAANQRPAVNVGLSVSRVGGKTQNPALRRVAARLRLDYAQFLELEMFTRFGAVSDPGVRARIERGRRIRALLTQPRYAPLSLVAEVALLAALGEGALDALPLWAIADLRDRVRERIEAEAPEAAAAIRSRTGDIEIALAQLVDAVRRLAEPLRTDAGENTPTEAAASAADPWRGGDEPE